MQHYREGLDHLWENGQNHYKTKKGKTRTNLEVILMDPCHINFSLIVMIQLYGCQGGTPAKTQLG